MDQDKLSTYTSLDDYGTLFEARHGRPAIDSVTISGERVPATNSPDPYFQQIIPERGQVLEGVASDIDLPVGALHEA